MKTTKILTLYKVSPNIDYVFSLNKYVFIQAFKFRKTKRKNEWKIEVAYQDIKL